MFMAIQLRPAVARQKDAVRFRSMVQAVGLARLHQW